MEGTTLFEVLSALAGIGGLGLAFWNAFRLKTVEAFKSELQKKTETEIASFKSDLQIAAHDQQLALSNLQEKRANVIDELYKTLVRTENALKALTSLIEFSDGPTKEERAEKFIECYLNFVDYYEENRIYLNANTCNEFQMFKDKYYSTFVEFNVHVLRDDTRGKDSHLKWGETFKVATTELPQLRTALEKELREILKSSVRDTL